MPALPRQLAAGTAGSGTSAATASLTPAANELVLAWVENLRSAGTPTTPTASGNSLTYVEVASVTFHSISVPTRRITLFRAMGSAPSAGAITFDFGGVTQDAVAWAVIGVDAVNTGGTNGSAAVVQSDTAQANSGGLDFSFGSATDPTNSVLVGWFATGSWSFTGSESFDSIVNDSVDVAWCPNGMDAFTAGGTLSNGGGIAVEVACVARHYGHGHDNLPSGAAVNGVPIVTTTGTQTLTNKTLTTPTIADFTNAQHDHGDADDGGTISGGLWLEASVNLTNAELLTLFSVGKEIIAAPGANKMIAPLFATIALDNAAAVYTGGGSARLLLSTSGTTGLILNTSAWAATFFTSDASSQKAATDVLRVAAANLNSTYSNKPVLLTAATADFGGGNSANKATVTVVYRIIDTLPA